MRPRRPRAQKRRLPVLRSLRPLTCRSEAQTPQSLERTDGKLRKGLVGKNRPNSHQSMLRVGAEALVGGGGVVNRQLFRRQ